MVATIRWPWQDHAGHFDLLKASAFALMFYPALWAVYHVNMGGFGPLITVGLIYWSGIWATALLLLALFVSPISQISGFRRLVTVRRIIGVSALFHTFAHIVIFLVLYRWDPGRLSAQMMRPTLIIATISTMGLVALGATSFDSAVRSLGAKNWKRLHRTNYFFTGLGLLHYLLSPGVFSLQYVSSGLYFWLMMWRLFRRKAGATEPLLLLILALVSCAFTILLQAFWMDFYQDIDFRQTLRDNLSLIAGFPAGWTVLLAGLGLAALPLICSGARRRARS